MKKTELIKKLNDIDGDPEITFPDYEYGGYQSIYNMRIQKTHKITEEGKRLCPTTARDYSDEYVSKERLEELYDKEEQIIVVLT